MDVEKTPWYEILYVMQSVTMISISMYSVGMDTTGPSLIMAACGYLRSLTCRLEQLGNVKSHQGPMDLSKQITSCVIYHQKVLELVYDTIIY